MQLVVILRTRHAVAQQAAMKGEAAVGVDDHLRRSRRRVLVPHAEPHAIEARIPKHLAKIGKHDCVAAPVRQPHRLDAGVVAEQRHFDAIQLEEYALFVFE